METFDRVGSMFSYGIIHSDCLEGLKAKVHNNTSVEVSEYIKLSAFSLSCVPSCHVKRLDIQELRAQKLQLYLFFRSRLTA